MNVGSWLLWGFVATVVLTAIGGAARGLRFTRMDFSYMLGTLFTPDRDRARWVGLGVHFLNGWIFSLLYVLAFESWRAATWWRGTGIGLVHGAFVLTVAVSWLPSFHPRMATEQRGPEVTAQLEPPGFMGLNYGARTPLVTIVAHIVFGVVLGANYVLKAR